MGTGVRFACITHGGPRPRGAGKEPLRNYLKIIAHKCLERFMR